MKKVRIFTGVILALTLLFSGCSQPVTPVAPPDITGIEGAIDAANEAINGKTVGLQFGNVQQSSVDVLLGAIDDAQAVADNPDSSEEDVNAAVSALNDALEVFNGSIRKVLVQALSDGISNADSVMDSLVIGSEEGNFSQDSASLFAAAIESAENVLADWDAVQSEIDTAVSDLSAAASILQISYVGFVDGVTVPFVNGFFQQSLSSWTQWGNSLELSIANEELVANITEAHANNTYEPKAYQEGLDFVDGEPYTVSFDARADIARDIVINVGKHISSDPWFYDFQQIGDVQMPFIASLTTSMQTYTFSFVSNNQGETTGDLVFELGAGAITNVYIDNIKIERSSVDAVDAFLAISIREKLIENIAETEARRASISVDDTSVSHVTSENSSVLTLAINSAQAVVDNGSATKTDLETAMTDLAAALDAFNSSIVVGLPATTLAATTPVANVGFSLFNSDGTYAAGDHLWWDFWGAVPPAAVDINGSTVYHIDNFTWALAEFSAVDTTTYNKLHFDFYAPEGSHVQFRVEGVGTLGDREFVWIDDDSTPAYATGEWISVDLILTDLTEVTKIVIQGDNHETLPNSTQIYIDNLYFYQ